jgi:hypothetical protein
MEVLGEILGSPWPPLAIRLWKEPMRRGTDAVWAKSLAIWDTNEFEGLGLLTQVLGSMRRYLSSILFNGKETAALRMPSDSNHIMNYFLAFLVCLKLLSDHSAATPLEKSRHITLSAFFWRGG